MQTYIEIILLGYIFSLILTREFLLCAHGRAGQTQLPFWWRILQSEIRNSAAAEKLESESEGGQKFLPPNPLPFCPPERSVSAARSAEISRDFVQKRFELRSVIATKLDIESFLKKVRARFARALGGFYSDFPPQSAIRSTNPSRLFWQAGGGSGARSARQMKFVSNFFLCRFATLRSQFLIPRFTCPPLADGQRRLTINL